MSGIFEGIVDWSIQFLMHYGYWAVFILMALETGMILHGVPSELIMTVGAAPLMHSPSDLLLIIFVGTLGAAVGSLIPYWAALYGGRPFILRHPRLFHMNEAKLDRLEAVFRRPTGAFLVFFCRLLPFLRAFVSIPAGLARMNFGLFLFLSTIGALIFNFVLAYGFYLTLRVPDSAPARAYEGLHAYFVDHGPAVLIIGLVVLVLVALAWYRRDRVAHHYRRFMPQGWEGAVVAVLLLLLLASAVLVAAPATLGGIIQATQREFQEAGRAEQTTRWLLPLLTLTGLIVLLFFIAAIRHEFAHWLAGIVGKQRPEVRDEPQTADEPPSLKRKA